MRPRVLIVIPARYGAVRFPGKPLVPVAGVPLVERVRRLCLRVPGRPRVVVATDDARIVRAVRAFGGEAQRTRRDHPSGTDRVAEVARRTPCDLVVIGTPIDLTRVLSINHPMERVRYELQVIGKPTLEDILAERFA